MYFGGMDLMFSIGSVMGPVIFIGVIAIFAVVIVRGVSEWGKNNASPVLTVEARIVSKRQMHSHHNGNTMGSTSYYVTFEVESGDRMELLTNGKEYGMLAEGDQGKLTFQGTRYKGFERSKIAG